MLLPIGLQDFQTLISQKTVGGITWCEHPFSVGGGGVNLLPNFQKGRLDKTLIFRGGLLGKRWVQFLHKR